MPHSLCLNGSILKRMQSHWGFGTFGSRGILSILGRLGGLSSPSSFALSPLFPLLSNFRFSPLLVPDNDVFVDGVFVADVRPGEPGDPDAGVLPESVPLAH